MRTNTKLNAKENEVRETHWWSLFIYSFQERFGSWGLSGHNLCYICRFSRAFWIILECSLQKFVNNYPLVVIARVSESQFFFIGPLWCTLTLLATSAALSAVPFIILRVLIINYTVAVHYHRLFFGSALCLFKRVSCASVRFHYWDFVVWRIIWRWSGSNHRQEIDCKFWTVSAKETVYGFDGECAVQFPQCFPDL